MKNTFFAVVLSLFMLSCSTTPTIPEPQGVEGKWLWIQSSGGFTGETTVPEPGSSRIYEFKKDGTFRSYHNGEVTNFLKYELVTEQVAPTGGTVDLIRFSGAQTLTKSVHIINVDTLHLDDWDVSDGFASTYTRVR